ncbi:flagellar biosynthesis protein FlgD [Trinickia symbiotica]|uniref:Basal-body rod modification protein FlgD n=1 Tax=Trinickia symbiotica TaxID=863227 RepID=A0A2T3XNF2_9BURK|nr:flagellar biosynthesis protein FlgD [Trinickia symbiotica]
MSSTSSTSSASSVSQQLLNTMNGTTSTSSSSTTSSSSSTGSSSATDLQTTFLKLLVTQLQNQDPTNPMDSSQMTSQLAQINTVSGISQLNTTLTSLASQLQAGQNAQSSLLIGQNVLVPGTSAIVSSGKSPGFGVELTSAATDVQVTIKDSSGNLVNTIDLGAQSAGTIPVSWTPTDSSGKTLSDGTYTISAAATVGGKTSSVTTLSGEQVLSVIQQSSGTTGLRLSDGSTVDATSVAAIL